MYEKALSAAAAGLLLCTLLSACGKMQMKTTGSYTFKAIDDESKLWGTSQLTNIIDGFPADYSEQSALVQGRLLQLFGAPLFQSNNLENQYTYIIEAANDTGEVCYLTAYHGSSGPAIGADQYGDRTPNELEKAAKALIAYIQAAEPTDFHWEGYYPDVPCRVVIGIENGKAYTSEEAITDPDKIQEMLDLVYGRE